jgi:hypothetical protein
MRRIYRMPFISTRYEGPHRSSCVSLTCSSHCAVAYFVMLPTTYLFLRLYFSEVDVLVSDSQCFSILATAVPK